MCCFRVSKIAEVGFNCFCSNIVMHRSKYICIVFASTRWGRLTHTFVSKLTIIGSDNGLWPGQRQDIIWTSFGILLIASLGTSFSEILIEIHTFFIQENAFENVVWKMAAIFLGLNVLNWEADIEAYLVWACDSVFIHFTFTWHKLPHQTPSWILFFFYHAKVQSIMHSYWFRQWICTE